MVGENLDLSSDLPEPEPGKTRRYVGIMFACCKVYARIYINRDGTAYVGNCPRCTRQVKLKVGPGGTNQRIFTAY